MNESKSVSLTRQNVLNVLQDAFPDIDWKNGRLQPYITHPSKIIGAVNTLEEIFPENAGYYSMRTILVQVYLPMTPTQNMTLKMLADPTQIEDLANDVINAMQEAGTGDDYWYLRPTRVDYPSDPNSQQTRAEIQFITYETSQW